MTGSGGDSRRPAGHAGRRARRGETRSSPRAMPHFWQNFPKAIEAAADTLTLRLFPQQYADVHEIQGGEQKTHEFFVAFGPRHGVTDEPLAWCRQRLARRTPPPSGTPHPARSPT